MNGTRKKTPSSKWAIVAIFAFGMFTVIELVGIGIHILREIFYWGVADTGIVSPAGIDADISRVDQVTGWHALIYIGAPVVLIIWLRFAKRTLSALRASGAVSTSKWTRFRTHFFFFDLLIPLRFSNERKLRDIGEYDDPGNLKLAGLFLLSILWLVLLTGSVLLRGFARGRVAGIFQSYYLCEFLSLEKAKLLASGILFWNKWIIFGDLIALAAVLLVIVLIKKINSRFSQVYAEMHDAGRIIDFKALAMDPTANRSGITPGFFQRAGGVVLVLFGLVVLLGAIGSMVSGTSKGTLLSQILTMSFVGILPSLGGINLYMRGYRKKRQSRARQAGVESSKAGDK